MGIKSKIKHLVYNNSILKEAYETLYCLMYRTYKFPADVKTDQKKIETIGYGGGKSYTYL